MTSSYDPHMPMNPDARAPDPHMVAIYSGSYSNKEYLARTDPLTMLTVNDNVRTALRSYDEDCVRAARAAGATWDEIAKAAGIGARQNAQRKWGHLG